MEDDGDYFKASSLAKLGVMRQGAIYQALKTQKLKATKIDGHLQISRKDFQEYLKMRYSREKSIFEGQLLHDPDKGEYSVKQAAKMLRIDQGMLYHHIRSGRLRFKKKGAAYVLQIQDIEEFKEKFRKL